jgi:integrase/recombinase XerD
LAFLTRISERAKQQTKRIRYSRLSSFFNCIRTNIAHDFPNPCDNPIYRLILELMARGGMRVGEVLKLIPRDIHDRKLALRDPKSGKERKHVFIPQKVADRLKEYIREKGIEPAQRIFPISYEAAREMVKKSGRKVGIRLRPHDLRRHAATYASRSGVPIEIVSKIIFTPCESLNNAEVPWKGP